MHKSGFTYDGHRVLTCDALAKTGLVRHGFSTRKEGVSTGQFSSLNLGIYTKDARNSVRKNFALFCKDAGTNPERLTFARQVHSTTVLPVTAKSAGQTPELYPECDGLVTNEPGVCLVTFSADCTPVLLLDPVRRVIASVHSGWRGTLGQIVCKAVEVMQKQFKTAPENVLAAIGPSIKQCHFEVDEDVYLQFVKQFGDLVKEYTLQKGNKYYIDTDALNRYGLISLGVLEENIQICSLCTFCEEAQFFSYRRDGETGRMCAVIELI